MRRNVDRSILGIILGLLLVPPMAAQRLRLESSPREQFRRLEEMRARDGLSEADVRAAREAFGLEPRSSRKNLTPLRATGLIDL